ncbi:hypothetical protein [Jannaschia rubra]|uniref:hypothetical protein n=1 Tax=Jannaschia rubra TaxID=282197 RepID=UPI0024904F97|nr:hypothetical protein [Jannaschia rubra]
MRIRTRRIEAAAKRLRARLQLVPWLPGGPDQLRPSEFRDLRVMVIGPAETVTEDLEGTDVDSYDVVVRLNNGLMLSEARPDVLGRRTDVLFHNLREEGERSAGAIPASRLNALGVGMVVYPHWRNRRLRDLYWAKRAELRRDGGPPVRIVPPRMTDRIRRAIGDRPPTVGTSAVMFFLDCPIAELAIHGFTFFETAYASGYNPAVRTGAEARAWVDARGAHEPLSEKAALRRRLEAPHRPEVVLGRHVRRHLYQD